MFIIGVIIFVGGVLVGTHDPLWVQGVLVLAMIIGMSTKTVRRMEMGALVPFLFCLVFGIGMIVGDISWFIQNGSINGAEISNPFSVQ